MGFGPYTLPVSNAPDVRPVAPSRHRRLVLDQRGATRRRYAAMQWARLQANLNIRLRRGAWYRIREVGPLQTELEVMGQPVWVPSAFLQIIETPPRKWTIVARPKNAVRLPPSWGDSYAVCPSCRGRQPLAGHGATMRCNRCKGTYEVGWNESYDLML